MNKPAIQRSPRAGAYNRIAALSLELSELRDFFMELGLELSYQGKPEQSASAIRLHDEFGAFYLEVLRCIEDDSFMSLERVLRQIVERDRLIKDRGYFVDILSWENGGKLLLSSAMMHSCSLMVIIQDLNSISSPYKPMVTALGLLVVSMSIPLMLYVSLKFSDHSTVVLETMLLTLFATPIPAVVYLLTRSLNKAFAWYIGALVGTGFFPILASLIGAHHA